MTAVARGWNIYIFFGFALVCVLLPMLVITILGAEADRFASIGLCIIALGLLMVLDVWPCLWRRLAQGYSALGMDTAAADNLYFAWPFAIPRCLLWAMGLSVVAMIHAVTDIMWVRGLAVTILVIMANEIGRRQATIVVRKTQGVRASGRVWG